MDVFSYKQTVDKGFAPNPFGGMLTLATCEPGIRRTKAAGEWVAGFTSVELCGDGKGKEKLIYLMKVAKTETFNNYFRKPEYQHKIPDPLAREARLRRGDNIYRPLVDNPIHPEDFEVIPRAEHDEGSRAHDLGGKNVLIAHEFVYFGRNAIMIDAEIRPHVSYPRCASNGTRSRLGPRLTDFIDFVMKKARYGRIQGPPHDWPEDDESWREER